MKTIVQDMRSRFGFHATPFTPEISVKDRFSLPEYTEAVEALLQTLDARMSCALIAPAGTGKTSVLRAVLDRLPEARYRTHYVKVTGLSKRDLCREIAQAIGLPPAGSYPSLVRKLQDRFHQTSSADGLRPVLIFDEAQDLRPDTLAMFKALTNFEMDSRLVLSIVLAGQSPLRDLLRRDDLEDVARRIAHYATLRTLTRDETAQYIEHRCTVAGTSSMPFDRTAIDAIFEIGRGNLRATDQISRKSLEIAHQQDRDLASAVEVAIARKLLWP